MPGPTRVILQIEIALERESGPFESRDSLAQALIEEVEGADPGSVEGDNGTTYNVTSWEVSDATEAASAKPGRHRR